MATERVPEPLIKQRRVVNSHNVVSLIECLKLQVPVRSQSVVAWWASLRVRRTCTVCYQ